MRFYTGVEPYTFLTFMPKAQAPEKKFSKKFGLGFTIRNEPQEMLEHANRNFTENLSLPRLAS